MYELDAYLDEIVARLDCDPLRRDEIRLEVHAHLRELLDGEEEKGRSPAEAAQAAIARFGPAEEVAGRLAAANRGRTPTRDLAAPGRRALAVTCAFAAACVAMSLLAALARMALPKVGTTVRVEPVAWLAASVVLHLAGGALAAVVVWKVSRQPWDVLMVCAEIALLPVVQPASLLSLLNPFAQLGALAAFGGAALVARYLSKLDAGIEASGPGVEAG
jgi:hypothetical protein